MAAGQFALTLGYIHCAQIGIATYIQLSMLGLATYRVHKANPGCHIIAVWVHDNENYAVRNRVPRH